MLAPRSGAYTVTPGRVMEVECYPLHQSIFKFPHYETYSLEPQFIGSIVELKCLLLEKSNAWYFGAVHNYFSHDTV